MQAPDLREFRALIFNCVGGMRKKNAAYRRYNDETYGQPLLPVEVLTKHEVAQDRGECRLKAHEDAKGFGW